MVEIQSKESLYKDVLTLAEMEDNTKHRLEVDSAFEYVEAKCRRSFAEHVPSAVKKAMSLLVISNDQTPNVRSESVGGELSITYSESVTDAADAYLKPFIRARFR
ncbi:hypothetical protein [Geomicrobium sediminis]|uniref:Phage gp6-like head-tail connector protein n=1 Tax=Geomicrobium sediminis TaxID=1347788 RepID=A0ABS2PF80_9BACL|nr:hypothetical protein [Geomicrobium sediminis]MBM7634073.1 hypothetical protein [Geomicrobium sediminis]